MLDQWDQQKTTQLRWIPPTPSDFLGSKPPLPSIYVDAQQFSLVACRQRFLSFLVRTPCWIYFGKNKQTKKAVLLVSSTAASSAFWRCVVVFLLFPFFRASIQKCGSRVKCGRRSSNQKVGTPLAAAVKQCKFQQNTHKMKTFSKLFFFFFQIIHS